ADMLVHNISETGLLLETQIDLAVGEKIDLALLRQQAATARVVWSSGALFGCRFDVPLSQSALSAARLQSAAVPPSKSLNRPERQEARSTHLGRQETFGARLKRLRLAKKL